MDHYIRKQNKIDSRKTKQKILKRPTVQFSSAHIRIKKYSFQQHMSWFAHVYNMIQSYPCLYAECNECILFLAECFVKTYTHTHSYRAVHTYAGTWAFGTPDFFALRFYDENVFGTKWCCACVCIDWCTNRTEKQKFILFFQYGFARSSAYIKWRTEIERKYFEE